MECELFIMKKDETLEHVTTITVPPFKNDPPEIIVWGQRVFVRCDNVQGCYIEGFAYWVP